MPHADDTPEHKAANRASGEEFLRVLMEECGEFRLIGEDLGVVPDLPVYQMTRSDLINHNTDLIAFACATLTDMPRQRLAAKVAKGAAGALNVTLVCANLQRVDVLVNGRPVQSLDVKDGSTALTLTAPRRPGTRAVMECRGFRDGELKASTRVVF